MRGDIFIEPDRLAAKLQAPVSLQQPESYVVYVDEVGVLPAFRRRSVAATLVGRLLKDFAGAATTAVTRTKALPPSDLYGWFLGKDQQVITTYDDDSGRVLLAGPVDALFVPSTGLEL